MMTEYTNLGGGIANFSKKRWSLPFRAKYDDHISQVYTGQVQWA